MTRTATRTATRIARVFFVSFFFTLAAIWMPDTGSAAERRVALIVGVANYAHTTKLAHSLADARDIAAALKRLAFDVDLVLDPNRADLEKAVRRFGERSRGADASLFYYSGHALESRGVNWILPVSANIENDRVLRFEALNLDDVRDQVQGLARVSLIFLDACRDDPFKQRLGGTREVTRNGLAPVNATTSGSYVAFATAPGVVASDGNGPHSPFTGSLLKYIEMPGLELRQVMSKVRADVEEATDNRQIPWDQSSLKGDFYFNVANSDTAAQKVMTAINGNNPQVDLDALFWESVDKKKPADLNAYLAKFPQGAFVELARNRLAELKSTPIAPPPAPNPKLLAALTLAQSSLSVKAREDYAVAYQTAREHKALAAYISGSSLRVNGRQTAQEAEESSLEGCEVLIGAACVLVALNDDVVFTEDSKPRPMPRVRYAGTFGPEWIPSVTPTVRNRIDVKGYVSAAGAKAAAFHSFGSLYIVTGAANLNEAERQALSACNDESTRTGRRGGPCLLYASNNDVVLPRRSRTPITTGTAAAQQDPPKPPVTLPVTTPVAPPVTPPVTQPVTTPPPVMPPVDPAAAFRAALNSQMEKISPTMTAQSRESMIKSYESMTAHKALAMYAKNGGAWRRNNWPTAEAAEEATLEGCQMYYGEPCTLLAVDSQMKLRPDGTLAVRDMPRLRYEGGFDVQRIPAIPATDRNRADVLAYATTSGVRAMAIHPWGQVYTIYGKANQNEAETTALATCNAEPTRKGNGGSCYLYATGNQVVFAKRLRLAMTPTPNAVPTQPVEAPKPVTGPDNVIIDALAQSIAAKLLSLKKPSAAEVAQKKGEYQNFAQGYVASRTAGSKAIAVGSNAAGTSSYVVVVYGSENAQLAEGIALERCQLVVVDACSVIASDRNIYSATPDGTWKTTNRPRLAHDDEFQPGQIPGITEADRKRVEVAAYSQAPSPKAVVIDAGGRIFLATGAKSQLAAEQDAFARCGRGVCYLYAVGNNIALHKRFRQPRQPGTSVEDILNFAMLSNAAGVVKSFNSAKSNKSIVFQPERGRIETISGYSSPEAAEKVGLESCGLRYNSVCITLVSNDKPTSLDPFSAPRPNIPRLTYQGPYRADMVPLFETPPAVANDYAKLQSPKALAIRPAGRRIAAETGATLAEAEAKALAKCADPETPYFPCFLYAVNDTVILPSRRTEARR